MRFIDEPHARRAVIATTGIGLIAGVVAACGGNDQKSDGAGAETATASGTSPAASGATSGAPGGALVKTADVPVGSGVIVDDLVVTQPTPGKFSGFSAVCPHAGCNVSKITDGKIVCPCHGSKFNLDGTVAQGPAKDPLESKAVSVQGDSIVAG